MASASEPPLDPGLAEMLRLFKVVLRQEIISRNTNIVLLSDGQSVG